MSIINQKFGKNWASYNGDCNFVMQGLPDNSVQFIPFSPPFINLYIYTDSVADLGNTDSESQFMEGFIFHLKEQYRILEDGKYIAIHCKDTMRYMSSHGYAGLYDFPGHIIRLAQSVGFTFTRWITIWKDPVIEMQRTKTYGLLHKSFRERAEVTRQGCADYVLILQKGGQQVEDKLPPVNARVIERCVHQWTNEGDLISTPLCTDIRGRVDTPFLSQPVQYSFWTDKIYDYPFISQLLNITTPGRLTTIHCTAQMMTDIVERFEAVDGWKFHSRTSLTDGSFLVTFRSWAGEFESGAVRHHLQPPDVDYQSFEIVETFTKQIDGEVEFIQEHRETWREPIIRGNEVHPDYVGTQPPIGWRDQGYYSILTWQRYASPVWFDLEGLPPTHSNCWMDIVQTNVLNSKGVKGDASEKHICLAKGSLVLTRDRGYIPIETILINDQVLTHTGNWQYVTSVRCNGFQSTVNMKAHGVANLHLTPNHNVWFRSPVWGNIHFKEKFSAVNNNPEWTPAHNTKGGYINLKLPPIEESNLTVKEWWIVGRWLGDGHRDTRGRYHISCSRDEKQDLVRQLGNIAGHMADTGTSVQVALRLRDSKALNEMLDKCGEGACKKQIPVSGLLLCQEKSEALLSGYLSADGHYVTQYNRYTASSVSRALLLGMAMVAQRARGVIASVYAGRKAGQHVIQGRTVNTKQDWIFGFRNDKGYRQSGFILDDGAWKKVRQVEEISEKEEVWDIQVEQDESFTAEGCIVHNCPLQLDLIEKLILEYTKPNEVVFTPYGGIGSEGYEAIKLGRKAILAELKPEYFKTNVYNLTNAEIEITQGDLI